MYLYGLVASVIMNNFLYAMLDSEFAGDCGNDTAVSMLWWRKLQRKWQLLENELQVPVSHNFYL